MLGFRIKWVAKTDRTNEYWEEYLEAIAKACGISAEEVEKMFGESLDSIATDMLRATTKPNEIKEEGALERIIRRLKA